MTTDNEMGQAPSTASSRCIQLRPSQVSALDLYDQLGADGAALHAVCCMQVFGASLAFNPTLFSATRARSILGEVTGILGTLEP